MSKYSFSSHLSHLDPCSFSRLRSRNPLPIQVTVKSSKGTRRGKSGGLWKKRKFWWSMEAGPGLGFRNMHNMLSEPD